MSALKPCVRPLEALGNERPRLATDPVVQAEGPVNVRVQRHTAIVQPQATSSTSLSENIVSEHQPRSLLEDS